MKMCTYYYLASCWGANQSISIGRLINAFPLKLNQFLPATDLFHPHCAPWLWQTGQGANQVLELRVTYLLWPEVVQMSSKTAISKPKEVQQNFMSTSACLRQKFCIAGHSLPLLSSGGFVKGFSCNVRARHIFNQCLVLLWRSWC